MLITPIKPLGYDKIDALLDANMAKDQIGNVRPSGQVSPLSKKQSASKWTCNTCLVQNEDATSSCACCMTARPGASENKKLAFDQTDHSQKTSIFATASAKWTCGTCLVANEASKDECACCMTKKSGPAPDSDSTKTKFSSLVAAAGSLSNFSSGPLNTSISFGLKPSATVAATTSEPIKFGFGATSGSTNSFTLPVASQVSFGSNPTGNNAVSENKSSFFASSATPATVAQPVEAKTVQAWVIVVSYSSYMLN